MLSERKETTTGWIQRYAMAARGARAIALAFAVILAAGPVGAAVGSSPIDINSASAEVLAELPGIGDAKAAAIIAERKRLPFASVDDLARVSGIGPRTLEDLRSRVKTGGKH